jgi:hypothetical protein
MLAGTGHVEKTNDRDYEVEERYAATNEHHEERPEMLTPAIGDSGQWRRRRCGYKKKPRDTLIPYEVRSSAKLERGRGTDTPSFSNDGVTDADCRNHRRFLRRLRR